MTSTTATPDPTPNPCSSSIWEREPELSIRLQELCALGLSFAKIANLMGLSRNQVISRARRMGIEKSREPQKANPESGWMKTNAAAHDRLKRERSRQLAKVQHFGYSKDTDAAPRMPVSRDFEEGLGKVTHIDDFVPRAQQRGLHELRDSQCRWPIGDPLKADFHFCPRDKISGVSYCEAHAKRAYVSVPVAGQHLISPSDHRDARLREPVFEPVD
jgi:GcrA cell cycle regulator